MLYKPLLMVYYALVKGEKEKKLTGFLPNSEPNVFTLYISFRVAILNISD